MHLQQVIVVVVEEATNEQDEEDSSRASPAEERAVPAVPVPVALVLNKHGSSIALLVGAAFLLALVYKMYGFF